MRGRTGGMGGDRSRRGRGGAQRLPVERERRRDRTVPERVRGAFEESPVGGGVVGTRRVRGLMEVGARVVVISPVVTEELSRLADAGEIEKAYAAPLPVRPVMVPPVTLISALLRPFTGM